MRFSPRRKYYVTNLKVNANLDTNITKWNDYNKIHKLSNFCRKLINEGEKDIVLNYLILKRNEIYELKHDIVIDKKTNFMQPRDFMTQLKKESEQ